MRPMPRRLRKRKPLPPLCITYPERMTASHMDAIGRQVKRAWPNRKVLVFDSGAQITDMETTR